MTNKLQTAAGAFLIFLSTAMFASVDTNTIEAKTDDGSVLTMLDGSVYLVDYTDRIDSALWLPTDDVVINDNASTCTYVAIINTDENNESVCARRIR